MTREYSGGKKNGGKKRRSIDSVQKKKEVAEMGEEKKVGKSRKNSLPIDSEHGGQFVCPGLAE